LAETPEEVQRFADTLIGSRLVTPQTGPDGRPVHRVLVEQPHKVRQEYYLGLVIDRVSSASP
jgi:succinyl-CoA synthetase beta subunit